MASLLSLTARVTVVGAVLGVLTACSSPEDGDDPTGAQPSTGATTTSTAGTDDGGPVERDAGTPARTDVAEADPSETVDAFVTAINAGDADAVAALFAPDARFDSVGRIYDGRDRIMGDFLVPEVIQLGGRYELLDVSSDDDRVVAEYGFVTDSGHREHFTYDCAISAGVFTDCIGDYV